MYGSLQDTLLYHNRLSDAFLSLALIYEEKSPYCKQWIDKLQHHLTQNSQIITKRLILSMPHAIIY